MRSAISTNSTVRKYLEATQDLIVLGLCIMLFVAMGLTLVGLAKAMLRGTDFSLVVGDVLFLLVLLEVFRLLIIYLEEHWVSVPTMVEVGIVSTLREVILKGALHIDWQTLLVISAFLLTLGIVLRYSGIGWTSLHPLPAELRENDQAEDDSEEPADGRSERDQHGERGNGGGIGRPARPMEKTPAQRDGRDRA
jgi:uncharacterized membrane protein (DUF373 family)